MSYSFLYLIRKTATNQSKVFVNYGQHTTIEDMPAKIRDFVGYKRRGEGLDLFKRANMELATDLEVMGCRYVSRRPCNRAKDKRLIARYARRKLRREIDTEGSFNKDGVINRLVVFMDYTED